MKCVKVFDVILKHSVVGGANNYNIIENDETL
jgi:hypothetical protein